MTYEYQNYIIRTTFCPFRTVTKSCPVETVPACPVQIRAHRYIAVYIDSNNDDLEVNWMTANFHPRYRYVFMIRLDMYNELLRSIISERWKSFNLNMLNITMTL